MIDAEDEEDEGQAGLSEDQERRIVRLFIGTGMLRRRAVHPTPLAQSLRERLEV